MCVAGRTTLIFLLFLARCFSVFVPFIFHLILSYLCYSIYFLFVSSFYRGLWGISFSFFLVQGQDFFSSQCSVFSLVFRSRFNINITTPSLLLTLL